MRKRWYYISILLLLTACNSLPSWLGGADEEKPKLPGDRLSALPLEGALATDASLASVAIILPAVYENADWPQHTGPIASDKANLAVKGFSLIHDVSMGEGNDFERIPAPPPVIAGGLVFVMDAAGRISAHDAADITAVRWVSEGVAEEDVDHTIGGDLAASDGKLYAVSGRGVVLALDMANGKTLWRKSMQIPFSSAPKVTGDTLLVTTVDNQVFALGASSGDVVWSGRGIDEGAGLMTSASPAVAGSVAVVPYSSGEMYALSMADGKEIWRASLNANAPTQASSVFSGVGGDPVIDAQMVIAVGAGGDVSAFDMIQGQRLWTQPVASTNTPWVAGDWVFILSADNTLLCLAKATGAIRWTYPLSRFENEEKKRDPIHWSGPVLVGGNVAVVSSNGALALISAAEGKMVSTVDVADDIYTAPVVAGGRMYLVTRDAKLYSLQ